MIRGVVVGRPAYFDVAVGEADTPSIQREEIRLAAGLSADDTFAIYCAPARQLSWVVKLQFALMEISCGDQETVDGFATRESELKEYEDVSSRLVQNDLTVVQFLVVPVVSEQERSERSRLLRRPGHGNYGTMAAGGEADAAVAGGRGRDTYLTRDAIVLFVLMIVGCAASGAVVAVDLYPWEKGSRVATVLILVSMAVVAVVVVWAASYSALLMLRLGCLGFIMTPILFSLFVANEREDTKEKVYDAYATFVGLYVCMSADIITELRIITT